MGWTPAQEAEYQRLKSQERRRDLEEFFEGVDPDFAEECIAVCLSEDESRALMLSENGHITATEVAKRLGSVAPRWSAGADFSKDDDDSDES